MLIPVHRLPYPGACKASGRAAAKVVAYAIVDDDMASLAGEFWTLHTGYACTWRRGKRVFLHHAVAGRSDGMDVSHENSNPLDCRRENLAHRTRSGNMLNPNDRVRRTRSSCEFRGVSRDNRERPLTRPWRGAVTVNAKTYYTPRFASPEEAALALNALRASLGLRVREYPR